MNKQVMSNVTDFRPFLNSQQDQMLKVDEVLALIKETRSSFYRRHPLRLKKIKIGRSSFWSLRTVLEWIQEANTNIAA